MFALKNFLAPVAPLRSSFLPTTLVANGPALEQAEDNFDASRIEEIGLMAMVGLFGLTSLIALLGA